MNTKTKNKIKKYSKYTMNGLAMINALIVGLSPIWEINADKITDSITVIIGVIGAYLVSGALFSTKEEENGNN